MKLLLLLVNLTVGVFCGLSVLKDDKDDNKDISLDFWGKILIHVCVGVIIGASNWLDNLDFSDLTENAIDFLWLANATISTIIPTWCATKSLGATLKATLWNRVKVELYIAACVAVMAFLRSFGVETLIAVD